MRYSLTLIFIICLSYSCLAFPYKVKWHKQSEIQYFYYSEPAMKDLRFFIKDKLKNNKNTAITRFQSKHVSGMLFEDGTKGHSNKKDAVLFNNTIIDMTKEIDSKKLPFDDKRRKDIIKRKQIGGFAEIQLLKGKEDQTYYISEDFKYLKIEEKYTINAVLKLINNNGIVIFFDFIEPGFKTEKYYEISHEDSMGVENIEMVLIEKEEQGRYNVANYSSWSIWN